MRLTWRLNEDSWGKERSLLNEFPKDSRGKRTEPFQKHLQINSNFGVALPAATRYRFKTVSCGACAAREGSVVVCCEHKRHDSAAEPDSDSIGPGMGKLPDGNEIRLH